MAYDLAQVNGYGAGKLGNVENPTGQLCSYANIMLNSEGESDHTITIGAATNGIYEKFEVGTEILVHVSGCISGSTAEYLGRYMVCKITEVKPSVLVSTGKILVLDKPLSEIVPNEQFSAHIVQVITIPQFDLLTLSTANISPIAYNATTKYGGILPLKCKSGAVFSGGNINLVDKGIPIANQDLRYWTPQEYSTVTGQADQGIADTAKYAFWENHITADQLLLNAGDGVVAMWSKKIVNLNMSATTRIGGTTPGTHYTRGDIGGSTILLAADQIDGFVPTMISKRKGTGRGLGRCYIATKDTPLRNDGALYAHDFLTDRGYLSKTLNVKGFGNATHGKITNPTTPLNNYATVTSISADGKTINFANKTTAGMAEFKQGAWIVFHVSKSINTADFEYLGKFIFARVLLSTENNIVLDTAVTKVFPSAQHSKYNCQIVSVAEAEQLTISTDYKATIAWDNTKKTGGICIIASQSADLRGGKINVEAKAVGGDSYDFRAWKYIGNVLMRDRLPIGAGHGSVLLVAKDVKMDKNTRIGALYSGANFAGNAGNPGGAGFGSGGLTAKGGTGLIGGVGGNGGIDGARGEQYSQYYRPGAGGTGSDGGIGMFGGIGGAGGNGGRGGYSGMATGGAGGNAGSAGSGTIGGVGGAGGHGGNGGSGGTSGNYPSGGAGGRGGNGGNGTLGGVGGNGTSGSGGGTAVSGVNGAPGANSTGTAILETVPGAVKYGGAHILAVIDNCEGFNIDAWSTGGSIINNIPYANGWQHLCINNIIGEQSEGVIAK